MVTDCLGALAKLFKLCGPKRLLYGAILALVEKFSSLVKVGLQAHVSPTSQPANRATGRARRRPALFTLPAGNNDG